MSIADFMKKEYLIVSKFKALEAFYMARDCAFADKQTMQNVILDSAKKYLKKYGNLTERDQKVFIKASNIAEAACNFAMCIKFDKLDLQALHNVVIQMNVQKYIDEFNQNVKQIKNKNTEQGNDK